MYDIYIERGEECLMLSREKELVTRVDQLIYRPVYLNSNSDFLLKKKSVPPPQKGFSTYRQTYIQVYT